MDNYKITFEVNVEFEDGSSDINTFSDLDNAKEYVEECKESGNADNNKLVWYKIEKNETSGGMSVSQETVEEWSEA